MPKLDHVTLGTNKQVNSTHPAFRTDPRLCFITDSIGLGAVYTDLATETNLQKTWICINIII